MPVKQPRRSGPEVCRNKTHGMLGSCGSPVTWPAWRPLARFPCSNAPVEAHAFQWQIWPERSRSELCPWFAILPSARDLSMAFNIRVPVWVSREGKRARGSQKFGCMHLFNRPATFGFRITMHVRSLEDNIISVHFLRHGFLKRAGPRNDPNNALALIHKGIRESCQLASSVVGCHCQQKINTEVKKYVSI